MNFLGIDTTGSSEIIVLHANGKDYVYNMPCTKHSESLLGHVEKALGKAKITLQDIDVFGNVSGPGSFTGIRIGLATIKAFAYALSKKVVNVSRFDVISSFYTGYVVLKCTKTSVYYAKIDKEITYGVCDISDLTKHIPTRCKVAVLDSEQIDLGDSYKNIVTLANYDKYLLPYMLQCVNTGKLSDSNNAMPLYIQLSQAERNVGDKK